MRGHTQTTLETPPNSFSQRHDKAAGRRPGSLRPRLQGCCQHRSLASTVWAPPEPAALCRCLGGAKPVWQGLPLGQGTACTGSASLLPGLWPMGTSELHRWAWHPLSL